MKAIVYTSFGPPDVLHLQEVEKPIPKENQILVKVHAASANPMDCWRFGLPPIFLRLLNGGQPQPKNPLLGADMAGRVAAVGANVKRWQPGDEIFGTAAGGVGAFAEYACTSENHVALKPANLTFEAAAAIPVAALTALQALRDKGQIQPGQKVLIQGASGGVGTFAVQIAKAVGTEVTAVCSTRNVETARTLGANHVIDYTQADFTKNGQQYDLIVAINGYHSLRSYQRALRPGGRCVVVGGSMGQIFQALLLGPLFSRIGGNSLGSMGIAKPTHKDLAFLAELIEAGSVTPVIDRCYPLREVAEAIKYVRAGHARGKVVISVEENHQ